MEKILLVKENVELCTLVKPFLEAKGIKLTYCPFLKQWSLKMRCWPTFRFFERVSPDPRSHVA